jgi:hypothetical protein
VVIRCTEYLPSILDLADHDDKSGHALGCVCSRGWCRVAPRVRRPVRAASLPFCFSGFAIPGAGGMVGNEEAQEPPARPGDCATGRVPRAGQGWGLAVGHPITHAGRTLVFQILSVCLDLSPLALSALRRPMVDSAVVGLGIACLHLWTRPTWPLIQTWRLPSPKQAACWRRHDGGARGQRVEHASLAWCARLANPVLAHPVLAHPVLAGMDQG